MIGTLPGPGRRWALLVLFMLASAQPAAGFAPSRPGSATPTPTPVPGVLYGAGTLKCARFGVRPALMRRARRLIAARAHAFVVAASISPNTGPCVQVLLRPLPNSRHILRALVAPGEVAEGSTSVPLRLGTVLRGGNSSPLFHSIFTNRLVSSARLVVQPGSALVVTYRLTTTAQRRLCQYTRRRRGSALAVLIDGQLAFNDRSTRCVTEHVLRAPPSQFSVREAAIDPAYGPLPVTFLGTSSG